MPFIVHPTDLSPTSEAAFLHALKLGLAAKAHLSLVHLHDVGSKAEPHKDDFPRVRDTLIRWGLLSEGATRAEVGDKLGLYLSKGMYLAGDPEAALTRLLRRSNTEFMVLGTRGLQGLRRLFDRSFSEELTRNARIPTLIVPQDAIGFVDIDGGVRLANILVPIAEAPPCVPAIRAAVRICRLLGQKANLHLLHVGDASPPAKRIDYDGLNFHRIVRPGPVVGTILEVAEEVSADLIVMATAGHKSVLDALRGSTTEAVLRKSHRPLLAVPTRSAYAMASRSGMVAGPSAARLPPA